MPRLPELLRPIADAELPHLAKYKVRSAHTLAWILFVVQGTYAVVNVASGQAVVSHALLTAIVNVSVCGAVIAAAKRPLGKARPDVLLFAVALLLLLDLALTGWVARHGRNDLVVYAPFVPLIMALFVSWRPSFVFLLLAPTLGCIVVATAPGTAFAGSVPTIVFATVSMTVASAIATQLQRRLWRQLERANGQLAAAERMSALGRMTAGIAHELKTPLAAVMNGLESIHSLSVELRDSVGHPDVTGADLLEIATDIGEVVRVSESGARRAAQFVSSIREQTLQVTSTLREAFTLKDVVTSAVTLLEHERRRAGVVIDTSQLDGSISAIGDRGKLGQIVTNLVHNAIHACRGISDARITVGVTMLGETITLVVEDDGPGVPLAHRARIFDALFTTKASDEGTGLGLAISRDIAEGAFGGTLELAQGSRGARFELCIPREAYRVSVVSGAWAPAQAADAA